LVSKFLVGVARDASTEGSVLSNVFSCRTASRTPPASKSVLSIDIESRLQMLRSLLKFASDPPRLHTISRTSSTAAVSAAVICSTLPRRRSNSFSFCSISFILLFTIDLYLTARSEAFLSSCSFELKFSASLAHS